jgi:hypothetical protein
MPNYDGRVPGPRSAVATAAWVPRVMLAPLTLVVQLVRWPVVELLRAGPVHRATSALARDVVRPREPQTDVGVSFVPTLVLERGRRPYGGASIELTRLGARRHRLLFGLATGGERFVVADAWDRLGFARDSDAGVRLRWNERPDNVFYGRLGPTAMQAAERWFWMRRVSADVTARD